ncbi:MAG: hypothetical protein A2Z18_09295 [Armatimonadetes bacterium RBG_16_58_9]|nr:MAG: hypothetical protein A2Z18_09295 [Armatimonadetes bacterium RBG_16_58_9]
MGLLARVAGKILDSSSEFFFVDDGSGQSVKVYGARPAGTCAVATGIVGYEILWQRVIRTRDALDVQGF